MQEFNFLPCNIFLPQYISINYQITNKNLYYKAEMFKFQFLFDHPVYSF